ncbi:hypothetical protein DNTS_018629 [Danionella cerebrum]|uniref:Tenascin n=1 Tax=Danionella cerebrum TaxID=2873325 RepID=A0A553RGK0_9TELE|nr:hypothetical protein DNTS_018629 [Danionella translucida]
MCSLTLITLVFASMMSSCPGGLVKKLIEQRREPLTIPGAHNITLSNSSKPIVFNHVYNIRVPGSSLCSVDLDAPGAIEMEQKDAPSTSEVTQHAPDSSNQVVFTHRINIPKQACGCEDGLPELKDLLSRLEMLEGQISTLKDQCGGESGCCTAQLTGTVGTKPYCGGHGNYSSETCGCICAPGWKGTNCTLPHCLGDCRNQGQCVNGNCECFEGFTGEDCSLESCSVDCGENGQCINGKCVCDTGYFGEDCTELDCLNNCSRRGRCVDGECFCEEPWTGFDCSELVCPKDCYDHGRCENGTCVCDKGFTGEDCGAAACPNDCSGRGFCIKGRCVCDAGYNGDDCSRLSCPNNCNQRGRCSNGVCICDIGFLGEDCGKISCPYNCNDRGRCVNGQCVCDIGFQGQDCAELRCPNDCNYQGQCVNGQCVCKEGFGSEDCGLKSCPSDCYGRGHCIDGKCICHANFAGEDCSELSCPRKCLNRGRCIAGQCVCNEGFTGEDCGQTKCPNDCLGRGHCVDGHCVCKEGFEGQDCSVPICSDNCNNRGHCVNGKCVCDVGFSGDSCSDRRCPNDCSDAGQCADGQCVCDEGYIGEDCAEVSPAEDLSVTDVTTDNLNLSWRNEMLVSGYLITYVPTAAGGLMLELTVPGDQTTATLSELEPGVEYQISVYAILNNKRSVPVSARVATHLPTPGGLKFTSIGETSVEVSWDQLSFPFQGWELVFRNTKEENGRIVNNLPPSQTRFEQEGLGAGQDYDVTLSVMKNSTRGPQTSATATTMVLESVFRLAECCMESAELSTEVSPQLEASQIEGLDPPGHMEVVDVTERSSVVSWSRPTAPVDGFTVSYGPSMDLFSTRDVQLSGAHTRFSLEDLKPDTEYKVSLSSRRGEARSKPITESLDAPRELKSVDQTESSITLQWKNSRSSIDGYRIKYGLKPGTEYGIGVTSIKKERESDPATGNAHTDLDPPRDLEVQGSSETSLMLVWKRPRAKISSYRLTIVSADGRLEETELRGTASSHTLNGLTPGSRYSFSLVSERGESRSKAATATASTGVDSTEAVQSSFTFYLANPFPELSSSTNSEENLISFVSLESSFSGSGFEDLRGSLNVSNVTSDGFALTWETNKLAGFDSYAVEVNDFSGIWKEVPLEGKVNEAEIRGLRPSTEYQARLYGVSKSERSLLLEAVAVTAKSTSPLRVKSISSPHPSVSTHLRKDFKVSQGPNREPPGPLNITGVSRNSLRLSWSAPEDSFDAFLLELKSNESKKRVIKVSGEARNTQVDGLSAGSLYEITLYGMKGGQKSQAVSAQVLAVIFPPSSGVPGDAISNPDPSSN